LKLVLEFKVVAFASLRKTPIGKIAAFVALFGLFTDGYEMASVRFHKFSLILHLFLVLLDDELKGGLLNDLLKAFAFVCFELLEDLVHVSASSQVRLKRLETTFESFGVSLLEDVTQVGHLVTFLGDNTATRWHGLTCIAIAAMAHTSRLASICVTRCYINVTALFFNLTHAP
jgi:hypothetical protein